MTEFAPSSELDEPGILNPVDDTVLAAIFTEGRTANAFTDAPVTDAELEKIWELARWAPTAANFQPLRVLYVQTSEGRAKLVDHMNDGNKAKTAAAPAVAVLALDSRFHTHLPVISPNRAAFVDVLEANEELRQGSAEFNSALQAGYFILAVRALGLAAGPMGGFDKTAVDNEFFEGTSWRSVLVVNIGHPAEDAYRDRQPRLEHSEVLRWA
ncbi:malonic semialdehyde reductase [Subtercola lobariae]|uniref:NADH dehydrogenase/NAD(P)H nitroreductase n=1 Tax=Subtercola lobariae TaxID=1588641 RepID=A0A917F100_9MICO|nr:malonic semialdehyde reductase [Subtercola lobariae]GGF37577.1 putative NADH dehydrogenase/NAD(P)H nitroreductase [Subtercola lobariae]